MALVGTAPGRPSPSAAAADRWASEVLHDVASGLAAPKQRLRVLRRAPKRLAIVETSAGSAVVLKQYLDQRGAWTARCLRQFTDAGLVPPARYAVTPALGWSSRHRTLVARAASGRPWSAWLRSSPWCGDAVTAAAAEWLVTLQRLRVPLPDRSRYRAEADLLQQSAELGYRLPAHHARLGRVVGRIRTHLYTGRHPAPVLVCAHGDFHPHNVFVQDQAPHDSSPVGVTAIDLDTAGLRRPSYDVGYALAQLLVTSWMQDGSFAVGAGAARVFWARWLDLGGADAEAVPAEMARALVQSMHFELVTYGTGRPELAGRWLDAAEAVLDHGAAGLDAALRDLASQETP